MATVENRQTSTITPFSSLNHLLGEPSLEKGGTQSQNRFIRSSLNKFLNSFRLACTLGLLPCLYKAKWEQLNGKTLQILKNSLLTPLYCASVQINIKFTKGSQHFILVSEENFHENDRNGCCTKWHPLYQYKNKHTSFPYSFVWPLILKLCFHPLESLKTLNTNDRDSSWYQNI